MVPRIGRKFMQVVAIEGFPIESYPGILTALAELRANTAGPRRFIFMDPHEAMAHLEKYRSKWRQKIRGFFDQVFNTHIGVVDQDAMSMVADAEAAIAEVNSGRVAQGYYTSVVVLMDENRAKLEALARAWKSHQCLGLCRAHRDHQHHGCLSRQPAGPWRGECAPPAHEYHEPGRPAADLHHLDRAV